MFTLNIRNIVAVGRGGMKWDSSLESARASLERDNTVADLLKHAEIALEEVSRFQSEASPDALKINRSVSRLGDILKKIDSKNQKNRTAVLGLLDTQIAQAGEGSDSKRSLTELKTSFTQEYSKLDTKSEGSTATVKQETKDLSNRTFESVIQKNSREIQAKNFTEYVSSKLSDPIKTQFLKSVTKEGDNGNKKYLLENISIPNLLQSISEGTVYIADGAEFNDKYALGKFMEVYNANKDTFDAILKPLAFAAKAGQSVESVAKSKVLAANPTPESVIQYLSQVDNFKTYGTTALDRQLSATTVFALDSTKNNPEKFLNTINWALILGGHPNIISSLEDLVGKPELKYAILAGIRQSSRLPGGISTLTSPKNESGIGENERKMLENIDATKMNLLDGLKDGFQSQLQKQLKDGTITAEKKDEVQKAIDAYIADLKSDSSQGWNIISKNLGAVITNRGAGVSGSATVDLPKNFLADNVNFGIGLSTGQPGAGVGITFDRAITRDTKILYGWAGSPFVGISSKFDKWQFTPIAGVGGALINVSYEMGNKNSEMSNMEGLKSAEKILSQIDGFSKSTDAKSIVFKHDVSQYPAKSDNPMEMTQERVNNLHTAINTDIQNRLAFAGYGKETNPVIRSQMIYNALAQAIQSRIDLLHLDDATGGFSLSSLGLTLGQFSGVPFILPSISFSRTSYTQSLKLQESQRSIAGKSEIIPQGSLFGTEVFSADGMTYSLPLAKDSKIKLENITKLPDNDVKIENGSIVGLKGYGINVTLKDGTYTIDYDMNKKVEFVSGITGQASFETLSKVESLKAILANKEVRIGLSHLWNNTAREKQVNTFTQSLQGFQKGEGTIEDGKNAFITLIKGLGIFKNLSTQLGKISNPKELQSALFDIRGAMMMDENQAKTITVQNGSINISESPDATKLRFKKIVASQKMRGLLDTMGLTVADYTDIIKGSGSKSDKITIGQSKPNVVGAIASLKTNPPDLALMPAGTMRFAGNTSGEFVKDISKSDNVKKGKMYNTILPEGSISEVALRNNIAKVLDSKSSTPINSNELRSLLVDGSATIGGKKVTMKETKYQLCAYGDCTNPGIAIEPGKISVDGKGSVPISANSISESTTVNEYNVTTKSGAKTIGLTGAIGYVGEKTTQEDTITTTPGEEKVETITTTPGEVKISGGNISINGNKIGVVNANGSITISNGTFRLANGQPIEAFLGNKGILIPNQTTTIISMKPITITSTSVTFMNQNVFSEVFNKLLPTDIVKN